MDDFQAMYNAGGHFKEQLEAIAKSYREAEVPSSKEVEVKEVAEVPVSPEIAPEIKEHTLPAGLADDYVKQVGMQTAAPTSVGVKLPLSSSQIQQGLHHKVWEAIRWLAQWCLRQMKMVSLKRA